ncbi:hypothetical protein [Streptomyces sp. NL15-2K]|uniref:hypothetical protein n=1 Tax=Streptomyces sp. NL15-2K TaxID=376149 RepID=UPI000FF97F8B|nr:MULTISPECIES: hypothetical protein [Actinomycetes]WKX15711.1 hypothetical protein Q4V64_52720 [Kutzneria buriramensis]GCB44386.1 aerobic C4-dicarboxylate transporter for fumarate, L-malate, D-malate [Streptomyces sp. NL15-2K]
MIFGIALKSVGKAGEPIIAGVDRLTTVVFKVLSFVMKVALLGTSTAEPALPGLMRKLEFMGAEKPTVRGLDLTRARQVLSGEIREDALATDEDTLARRRTPPRRGRRQVTASA